MSYVINIDEKNAEKLRKSNVTLDRQNNGSVKTTSVKNVVMILLRDPNLKNLFRLNEFTQEIDVVKEINLEIKNIGTVLISKGIQIRLLIRLNSILSLKQAMTTLILKM